MIIFKLIKHKLINIHKNNMFAYTGKRLLDTLLKRF